VQVFAALVTVFIFFLVMEEAGDEEDCKKAYDALGELLTATLFMNSENDPYFP